MAREKIQKEIDNKGARHVTFFKRRRGFVKKAQELSILCEAGVALIVFSTTGKPYEYPSSRKSKCARRIQKSVDWIILNHGNKASIQDYEFQTLPCN